MDPFHGIVKEEFNFDFDLAGASAEGAPSSSSWAAGSPELPRPMEGLGEAGPTPFLNKTYDVVDDPATDTIVSWGFAGTSFVVWDVNAFVTVILPRYFKHSNFSSFVRQLNTYGFRKVDPDRWEFANEGFLRGKRELLKTIKRRRPPSTPSAKPVQAQAPAACLEVGQFGLEGEVHRLQRDKGILVAEVVKLRQDQQATRAQMQAMEERITAAEKKQQQMTVFLARAMKNPGFLKILVDRHGLDGRRRELEDALSKKRRRPIEYLPRDGESSSAGAVAVGDYVSGLPVGVDGVAEAADDDGSRRGESNGGGEDTESFWVELLSLGLDEKHVTAAGEEEEGGGSDVDDDVDVLVQSIYHLNPNPGSPSSE